MTQLASYCTAHGRPSAGKHIYTYMNFAGMHCRLSWARVRARVRACTKVTRVRSLSDIAWYYMCERAKPSLPSYEYIPFTLGSAFLCMPIEKMARAGSGDVSDVGLVSTLNKVAWAHYTLKDERAQYQQVFFVTRACITCYQKKWLFHIHRLPVFIGKMYIKSFCFL